MGEASKTWHTQKSNKQQVTLDTKIHKINHTISNKYEQK
jgi:hypothetical protein